MTTLIIDYLHPHMYSCSHGCHVFNLQGEVLLEDIILYLTSHHSDISQVYVQIVFII